MREILFRGKIIEPCHYCGQWLEGFYGVDDGKTFIAIQQKNGLNGFFCDPLTVGQYTGLTDKNGTRIFEGDIVKFDSGEIMIINWDKEGATFILQPEPYESYEFNDVLQGKIEVIGNIHDNPELLGVAEND